MADTVKTQVMKALATVLGAEVPEITAVERRSPIGTDLDKIRLPTLFLYDEGETGAKANRLRKGIIEVEMAVFIKITPKAKDPGFQAFEDMADTIAGRVDAALQTNQDLVGLMLQAEEILRRKAHSETLGELVLQYRITYGHAAGDAFTTTV